MIVTVEELAARRAVIATSADLPAMRANLEQQLAPFLERPVYVPERKALLSRWGSLCRDCRAELDFDPWSPEEQRCTGCGRRWATEHSRRWWIYWYQLWLAERVWQCALLGALGGDARTGPRAAEALALIAQRYPGYPNADNVLGPSKPFFSTYLESIWVLQLVVAADLLRQHGHLGAALEHDLAAAVFRPSADIIADFDEGRSNRQVWNAAALYALGRFLGDAPLSRRAAQGDSGILGTLDRGLLDDGLWYEGENYHWFALRGLVWGVELLRAAGEADLWTDGSPLAGKLRRAFHAPVLTALPDFTFPARRDSKFGVSLRQRRMAELWELAYAAAQRREDRPPERDEIGSLLRHVYDPALPAGGDPAREITEVERGAPPAGVRRQALGWKGLLWAPPLLRDDVPAGLWQPGTAHLEATGLAIFRRDGGQTYLSLDYGESGGGHGHPDRLNVTYVERGTPWLLDFGTGSYLTPSLAWYRSSLAHNAPFLDGASQAPARGYCVGFDEQDEAAWVCALLPEHTAFEGATIQRTLVQTADYVLDVLQMGSSTGERQLLLPWHGLGEVVIDQTGLTFTGEQGRFRVLLAARQPFQVQLAEGYGPPVTLAEAPKQRFAVVVAAGEELTLAACLTTSAEVEELECIEDEFIVRLSGERLHVHHASDEGWTIQRERGDPVMLGGVRDLPDGALPEAPRGAPATEAVFSPLAGAGAVNAAAKARSVAVGEPPALDGTLDGFDLSAPLALDRADQFRRAETPWEGAARFSATAWLNHDDEHVYVAIDVVAPAPQFRPAKAPNPEFDNENPDVNSDGVQLFVATSFFYGWVVVPDSDDHTAVRATPVSGTDAEPGMVRGGWAATDRGYRLTLALALPDAAEGYGFDLLINRMEPGRERRSGQLVWSGAAGERLYLAGDRPVRTDLPWVAT
jgi:hypothetical protein